MSCDCFPVYGKFRKKTKTKLQRSRRVFYISCEDLKKQGLVMGGMAKLPVQNSIVILWWKK